MRRLGLSIRFRLALQLAIGLCLLAGVAVAVSWVLVNDGLLGGSPQVAALPVVITGAAPGTAHLLTPGGMTQSATYAQGTALSGLRAPARSQAKWSLVLAWAAVAGGLVAASGLLGWLLTTRMLRRLRRITGAAQRLSAESLDQRIALAGPRDELRELADTFDGMLSRLDAAFAGRRRFTANAAHELRTPLAIIRTQVDVALSDPATTRTELLATVRVVGQAVDRCQSLLEGLMILARGEAASVAADPVDLAQIAAQAVARVGPRAESAGVTVRATCSAATVRCDRVLLERAAGNLVENAVAYNHGGGWVEVTAEENGDRSRLRVTNSGPVVPPGRVDDLFEPFVRLAPDSVRSVPGAGLGLSIVRTIAGAHGGTVSARALSGGGLEVTFELPVAREAGVFAAARDQVALSAI